MVNLFIGLLFGVLGIVCIATSVKTRKSSPKAARNNFLIGMLISFVCVVQVFFFFALRSDAIRNASWFSYTPSIFLVALIVLAFLTWVLCKRFE